MSSRRLPVGYSATAILPGEDRTEFEKLHRGITPNLERSKMLSFFDIVGSLWAQKKICRIAEIARQHC
jgi:hypothetical protein